MLPVGGVELVRRGVVVKLLAEQCVEHPVDLFAAVCRAAPGQQCLGLAAVRIVIVRHVFDGQVLRIVTCLFLTGHALADAKAAADKKAKAAQTAAEKEKAARDKAQTAARSDARRQIALILRNGGTVPDDLWQQSGYSAVTIAAMLRGRKG